MKPRAFIGSSVQGLNLANAIHQNLWRDAEPTVWNQGCFELSKTSIETLMDVLDSTDFGIFVFTPDDMVQIRGKRLHTVRDNVLFEMGLFIGRLGRSRTFFIVPSNSKMHLPSDILGVTPGTYDTERSDGNLQAATTPVCEEIKTQIKKHGCLAEHTLAPSTLEQPRALVPETPKPDSDPWIFDFIDRKYKEAKTKIETESKTQSGNELVHSKIWIYLCEFKLNKELGLRRLYELAKENSNVLDIQTTVAFHLRNEYYTDLAIKLLQEVSSDFHNSPSVRISLADCYLKLGDSEFALATLQEGYSRLPPGVALKVADILRDQGKTVEALEVIHRCYIENPQDESITSRYALLTEELDQHQVALYLCDSLLNEHPDNLSYWVMAGNACYALALYDQALIAYRKAESLGKPGVPNSWTDSNIGNLFSTLGLRSEACVYLERAALSKSQNSQYGHERLAIAMKLVEEGRKDYKTKCAEGLKLIRAKETTRLAAINTEKILANL